MGCIMGCKGKVKAHGLCGTCWGSAYKKVRSGETTWEKLAEEGYAIATVHSGGKKGVWLQRYEEKHPPVRLDAPQTTASNHKLVEVNGVLIDVDADSMVSNAEARGEVTEGDK